MNVLVSVIIPTYKRHDTICRAVDSVLNQTFKDLEVIVVDDNEPGTESRKLTEEVMAKYSNNNKVHYIKHPRNINGSAARNTGFRMSRGKYIALLDDDDEFFPQKIEAQVTCLSHHDISWGACYANYIQVDSQGKLVMINGEHREGDLFIEELKRNLFIHAGSNIMLRRTVFEHIGGFDESFLRNQDIEFMVRLLKEFKLAYVNTPGVIVYMHKKPSKVSFDELTKQYRKTFEPYINMLDYNCKNDIDIFLNLQLFRSKIMKKSTRSEGLKMITNGNVNTIIAIRYCFHLLMRRITRKAYGFKL